MLGGWLPKYCSRLSVFISYPSEQHAAAERIAQAIKNAGHRIFFDKESLPPASDYHQQIQGAIRQADRFVFLASREALEPGKFTLTELEFARKKWPAPVGRVLPVIVDPELSIEALPTYLSSVHVLRVVGNAPAEISAALQRTTSIHPTCKACGAIAALTLAFAIALASGTLSLPFFSASSDVALVPPEYVIFRPRARPPDNPSAPDADTAWLTSPLTITLPVAYSSQDPKAAPAQLQGEDVSLRVGDSTGTYAWTYIVEIVGSSIAGTACADWLCPKGNVKPENLVPGQISSTRETMYLPVPGSTLSWSQFIDTVLDQEGPETAAVTLRSNLVGPGLSGGAREFTCTVDLTAARLRMREAGFQSGSNPRPATWQPRCKSTVGG